MQFIPKDKILEHHPDTLMDIRKEYNLEKPGEMGDAIRILREWVQQQQHFKKKDFNDYFLETTIIACKGSIERAKTQLDRICTFRTMLPQYFEIYNVKTDFAYLFEIVTPVILPKLTKDHYRVFMVNVNPNIHLIKDYAHYFIYDLILSQYIQTHDYCRGFYIIADMTKINIMEFLSHQNPVMLRQVMSIFVEGIGMRVKGMHIFSPSKLVDSFVSLMKQVSSPKVASRIHSHKTLDVLPDILPLEILPEEYGGKERSMGKLLEEWTDILSSKEHMDFLRDMQKAGTDESCRQTDKFTEQYAGMPGTFRLLTVD